MHARRRTSMHMLTFPSPQTPIEQIPPVSLVHPPDRQHAWPRVGLSPQSLTRLSRSTIPNHNAGRTGWVCDGHDFGKMYAFGKKGVPQPPGQPDKVTCLTWVRELGVAQPSPAASPRGPTGKPLTARYLQLNATPGLQFPPCFLLPHCPQHLSTEIVPSLKLESTNRSRWGCGTRAGGKDSHHVQDWGAAARGGQGWASPQRGPTGRQGTGKNSLQVTRHRGGKGRARTAWGAGIWDQEPSRQLDEALWTGTGQG